mgnify:CR=1 FL=1
MGVFFVVGFIQEWYDFESRINYTKRKWIYLSKFKTGDKAFILESNRIIREVTIAQCSGGMYLIKFSDGGGIQVKEHRLFATKEEAEAGMPGKKPETKKYRSPYDYGN